VYRNIYRVFKPFYLIPIYLDYIERRILVNIFILILGPYNTNIINIIEIFNKFILDLDYRLKLEINNKIKLVYTLNLIFLEDIP
jgi:hypothetical protein